MGRFLLTLSFLLVFVAATGFCQRPRTDDVYTSGPRLENEYNSSGLRAGSGSFSLREQVEEIVRDVIRDVIRDELQSIYWQQPVPAPVSPAININISPNISPNERFIPPVLYSLKDTGQSRQQDIVDLIVSKNRRTSRSVIEGVVTTYFAEAKVERINHDIAIAQMLYASYQHTANGSL